MLRRFAACAGLLLTQCHVESYSTWILPSTSSASRPHAKRTSIPTPTTASSFVTPRRRAHSDVYYYPKKDLLLRYQSTVGMDSSNSRDSDGGNGSADALDAAAVLQEEAIQLQQKELTRMILNGLLLAVTFGYAAYTILNIDSGMTRGWTQGEIAMRIPLDNWLNYESSLADRPVFTKTAINVIIYLLGDWLSQTLFAKKHFLDFDAARTLRNGFIGLCFGPLVHEYYQFSDYILPVEAGMFTRLQKILMDQTIYLTVKCSIYISAVGLLQGDDWSTVKTNVQTKLPNIVLTAWKFWPLVHLVTYGVIPARHRILWVNCVDLVWNAILATMSQKKEDVVQDVVVLESSSSLNVTETSLMTNSTTDAVLDTMLRSQNLDVHLNSVESLAASGESTIMASLATETDAILSTRRDAIAPLNGDYLLVDALLDSGDQNVTVDERELVTPSQAYILNSTIGTPSSSS
jgi:protein Mpv17